MPKRDREEGTTVVAFGDKSACPTGQEVLDALGSAAQAWSGLVAHVSGAYPPITEHWSFSSPTFGWSLRLKQRDRIVVYLTPRIGCFLVGIVLGAKAVDAARREGLPDPILAAIAQAPTYAEGTGLRLTIAEESELSGVERLLALKMA